ncbi:DUF3313 domain-containing protein [Pseudomonas guineae]|uniref:DUF3313 domain-containing protein n=1 Tax=Pseudomonas guineae TaxID=425504 RepID=UPI003CFBCFD5
MKTTKLMVGGLLTVVVALGGCTTKTANQSQYSGFLSSYEGLSSTKTSGSSTVLRWVDPSFDVANYQNIIYQPVRFHPEPLPTKRLSQKTLQDVLAYTNSRLSKAMFSRLKPVGFSAGPGTLVFRGAITGVTASTEGLKPYEIIPVALMLAGAMTASGARDQNTELYLEGELVDTTTGKTMLRVVRKGFGKTLSNDSQPITADDLKSVIDDLTRDVLTFK